MTKTIAFYRVSELLNRDIDTQRDTVELYCKKHNLIIIDEIVEEITVKRSINDRPAIIDLISKVEILKPEFVIIPKLGGFAYAGDMVNLLTTFHAKGVGLISVEETIWTIKDGKIQPSTTIMLQALNAAHEFEIDYLMTLENLKK